MSSAKHRAATTGVALVSGAIFGVGLAVAGMTQPSKVIGFLDVAGDWDPSLAFVMMGAIGVYFVAHRFATKRTAPFFAAEFHFPTKRDVDPRLVLGAAIFGVGWGLGGYCPGPGLTALGTGSIEAIVFVATMAAGMWLAEAAIKVREKPEPLADPADGTDPSDAPDALADGTDAPEPAR